MTNRTIHARDGRRIQALLDYADAAADWLLEYGEDRLALGSLEEASRCAEVAASILWRQNRSLTCPRLERLLLGVASAAPDGALNEGAAECSVERGRLHVLTEALPAGGLTAMATRWILNDPGGRPHHVALLAQGLPVPRTLREAVALSGGAIHVAPAAATIVAKALWLRRLARRVADPVVLHVDV